MGGSTKIAVMWRGDWRAPGAKTHYETRLRPIMAALQAAQFEPVPIVFFEEQADAARETLKNCAGALVWINPVADGRDRSVVDAILREAAERGAWVSAHPDVIAKMGVKDVLYTTRELGWGSDTERYNSHAEFCARFDAKIASGPRVLKPHRGNDGQGVMKVSSGAQALSVQFATDDHIAEMSMEALRERVTPVFAQGGRMIDQAFQATASGMVRCYLSFDQVIGFARQAPRTSSNPFAMNSAKTMFASDEPAFADLRESMSKDWVPGLKRTLELETAALPALWDADFLMRGGPNNGRGRYALCEINVSCVSPFPDVAPIEVAQGVRKWVRGR
jgi:hypothetical protein